MNPMPKTAVAALFALILGAPAFAEPAVPRLDVGTTCRPIDKNDKTIQIDTDRCFKTEDDARGQLVKQWSGFPAADRTLCTQTASMGGASSYVQLLTCLEMRRAVANSPAEPMPGLGRKR